MFLEDKFIINNIECGTIRKSNIHGYGLFANCLIKEGTVLCNLDGQLMEWDQYDTIFNFFHKQISPLDNYFFVEWNALDDGILLVRSFRTKYSFINHSRIPNLRIFYDPIRVEAISGIESGSELFLDYRMEPLRKEYLDGHGKSYL